MNTVIDESEFVAICERIRDTNLHDGEQFEKLCELERIGAQTENQFLSENLREIFNEFNNRLGDYLAKLSMNSFNIGGNHYALHPERKYSNDAEQRKIYLTAVKEIGELSNEVLELYREFRREIKSTLYL